ncbi:MAG: EAL domain-containing protein [Bacillota bacterium]
MKEKITNSFRNKLIVLIAIISIIVFVIISLISNHFISDQINNIVKASIKESTAQNVNFIADWFDGIKRELKNYSDTPFIREVPLSRQMNWSQIKKFLSSRYQDHDHIYEYLFIVEPGGDYSAIPEGRGNVSGRSFYKASLQAGETYITNSFTSSIIDDSVIVVSTPINLTDDEIEGRGVEEDETVGIMAGAINLDTLTEIVSNIGVDNEESFSYIIDAEGEIIAHPDSSLTSGKNITELDGIQEIADNLLAQSDGQLDYNNNGEQTHLYFEEIPETNGWKLITVIPDSFISNPVTNILIPLLVMFVVALAILLLASYLIGNYITQPLESITNYSRKISNKDFSTSTDISSISKELKQITNQTEDKWLQRSDEIGVLARSYQAMKDNLMQLIENLATYGEEITELNQELEYQAFHDPLTELPNRRKFIAKLKEKLEQKSRGAVFLLDIDNFKEINDTLGHLYGDEILKSVGDKLLELEDEGVYVARYGGDEFLLLVQENNQRKYIRQKLEQLEFLFKQKFSVKDNKLDIDYSVGIARYPVDADTTDQLITNADTAMYQAKELGKKHLYYNQEMIEELEERKRIKDILKQALEEDGFKLKYQPQVNLKTGRSDHLEALIRLEKHQLSPGKFIPVAEQNHLIIDIGRWVTEEAINQLAIWQEKGMDLKAISINFSVRQLKDDGYIEFLEQKLQEKNIPASLIKIEITESILIEKEKETIEFLSKLRNLGVKIVLDDFGTGYSSLNYLTYIDLDRIKLDKSLSDKFLGDNKLETMDNLIGLFHTLDLPVVAEGIETKEQYDSLILKNCDYIQGFLFSKPLVATEIEKIYDKDYTNNLT